MTRYNSNYILIFAPNYNELRSLFGEQIFQEFFDLFSIKGDGNCFEIAVTQLGSVPYISDRVSQKYPNFLFLETRSGESGYKESFLTKGSFRKKLNTHFELVPRNSYLQLDNYMDSIKSEEKEKKEK